MAAKILLADDEDGWLELAGFWLRGAGYEVRTIGSGKGVFPLAREFRPDCFVLDHDLGDVTAREVCRSIRADAALKAAKIVIITAHAGVLPEILADGPPDQFVAKSEHPEELLMVLAGLLE
jgi:CheY-like chemotaxis protein